MVSGRGAQYGVESTSRQTANFQVATDVRQQVGQWQDSAYGAGGNPYGGGESHGRDAVEKIDGAGDGSTEEDDGRVFAGGTVVVDIAVVVHDEYVDREQPHGRTAQEHVEIERQRLDIVGEVYRRQPEEDPYREVAQPVIGERVGAGRVGQCRYCNDGPGCHEPPPADGYEQATQQAGDAQRHDGGGQHGARRDVARRHGAAGPHAVGFVAALAVVEIVVAEVRGNLCQQGKKETCRGHAPMRFPMRPGHGRGYQHGAHRCGPCARAGGFDPYFEAVCRSVVHVDK